MSGKPGQAPLAHATGQKASELNEMRAWFRPTWSLDALEDFEDDFQDMGAWSSADSDERMDSVALVNDMFSSLTERQQLVLRMRHGFDSAPMTLEQVGGHFGFTRERARQIEAEAVRILAESYGTCDR